MKRTESLSLKTDQQNLVRLSDIEEILTKSQVSVEQFKKCKSPYYQNTKKRKSVDAEKVFKEAMAGNCSNFTKDINQQIQKCKNIK